MKWWILNIGFDWCKYCTVLLCWISTWSRSIMKSEYPVQGRYVHRLEIRFLTFQVFSFVRCSSERKLSRKMRRFSFVFCKRKRKHRGISLYKMWKFRPKNSTTKCEKMRNFQRKKVSLKILDVHWTSHCRILVYTHFFLIKQNFQNGLTNRFEK